MMRNDEQSWFQDGNKWSKGRDETGGTWWKHDEDMVKKSLVLPIIRNGYP